MMIKSGLTAVCFVVFLAACSRPVVKPSTPEGYFERGVTLMKSKDYRQATEQFQKVRDEFPFSSLVTDAELRIAECQYLQGSYIEAVASFKDFQKMHPTNENIPFVIYRLGLSHLEQSSTIDRDQTTTGAAIDYFRQVLTSYPTSKYAELAREKLILARRNLAEHEFYIGHFYFRQANYRAALERFAAVLRTYYETETAPKALLYMRRSYQQINDTDKAKLVGRVFEAHYPESPYRSMSVEEMEESSGLLPSLSIPFLSNGNKGQTEASRKEEVNAGHGANQSTAQMKRFISFEKGEQPPDIRQGLASNDPLVQLLGGTIHEEPVGLLAHNRSIQIEDGSEKKKQAESFWSSISPFYTRPPDLTAPIWDKRIAEEKNVMVSLSKEEWGGAEEQKELLPEEMLLRLARKPSPASISWTPPDKAVNNGKGAASNEARLNDPSRNSASGVALVAQAATQTPQAVIIQNSSARPPHAQSRQTSVSEPSQPLTKSMVTVGVYPFQALNPELKGSLTETIRQMLRSRIQVGDVVLLPNEENAAGDSMEDGARLAGKRSGSDYVLFGTFSKVADWITIDARLLDVTSARVVGRFGAEGDGGLSGVVPTVVKLTSAVNSKLLELASSTPAPSTTADRTVPASGVVQSPPGPASTAGGVITAPAARPQPASAQTSLLWEQTLQETLKKEPPKKSFFDSLLSPFRSSSSSSSSDKKIEKQPEGTIIPEIEEKLKNSSKLQNSSEKTLDQEGVDGESTSLSGVFKDVLGSVNPF